MVARLSHKQKVTGSTPVSAIIIALILSLCWESYQHCVWVSRYWDKRPFNFKIETCKQSQYK